MLEHLLFIFFVYIFFNLSSSLTMKVMYSWLIYSSLIFGSGILCDRNLEKRQVVSSCSKNTEDKFYCSNGLCIELSQVCDGHKDCSDGSDETKALCAQYENRINMTMDCGKVYGKNQVLVDSGEKAVVGTAPWNVGIYRLDKESSEYEFLCGGSIIASNVVISGAVTFWEIGMLSKETSINYGLIKVAVGKYDKNFTVFDNDFIQILNVETIYQNEGFNGLELEGYFADDIAVIVLANKVSFSNVVAPVCIDWNDRFNNVVNGDRGKVVVWGDTINGTQSPDLLEISLPYIDRSTCRTIFKTHGFQAFVTYDKFCAGSELVSALGAGVGDAGTGISFLHSNSYYLTGVVSAKDPNTTDSVALFTDIKYHVQWIRGLLNKHATVNSCVLPTAEGVVYSYEGSNQIIPHRSLVKHHRTVIENCEAGYHKTYPYGFRVCQGKGKWISNSEKLCFKKCPPLESDSLDIKCTLNGKYANCSNLSIPDTIATPSCKATYIAPKGREETPRELHCQSNGTWNEQLYSCDPYCGRVYGKSQLLIDNGEKAIVGTAPWNAGVYRLNKKKSEYDLICGGSIISPNLVISAAHCFWQKGMLSKRLLIKDGQYKISVGKYNRNLTIIDNDFTQIVDVDIIHLKEGYYGNTGFHAEDIAIVVLKNRIFFSNGVSPACIDWKGKYNVFNGNQGKIVGWGKTEKGILNPILLEASVPYIDHSSCRNMYNNGFEQFVTVDKFCAGSALVAGQGVGKGDTGAGLCFLHSNSYYLTGLVSIKDSDTNNSIAVFTEIKYHIEWIRELYDKQKHIK